MCFHFAKLRERESREGLVPFLVESTLSRTEVVLRCPNMSLVPPRASNSLMRLQTFTKERDDLVLHGERLLSASYILVPNLLL